MSFKTLKVSMPWKRKVGGGLLTMIGFMLSPLSWWNDLFVNLPLALAFAWLISLAFPHVFEISLIVGYWLTNVLGFVLMHKGVQKLATKSDVKLNSRGALLRDVGISIAYTILIVALIKLGVLKPITDYFESHK